MGHGAPGPGGEPEAAPNHERWVISYADLLTLLLAFFVVLYASSTQNRHKMDQEAESFVKAFHGTPASVQSASTAGSGVMQHSPSPVPIQREKTQPKMPRTDRTLAHQVTAEVLTLDKVKQVLQHLLQPLIDKHEVSMQSQPLTLTIQLDASVLFPSGEADLKPPAMQLLTQVGASLVALPPEFTVNVEGFTDNKPIDTALFPNNWALSAARAVTVVTLFQANKLPGGQMCAQGFGEFAPVASNDTDAGRAKNRRVVIVIHAPDLDGTAHGK
jgi:chemotaxis protein MotB